MNDSILTTTTIYTDITNDHQIKTKLKATTFAREITSTESCTIANTTQIDIRV